MLLTSKHKSYERKKNRRRTQRTRTSALPAPGVEPALTGAAEAASAHAAERAVQHTVARGLVVPLRSYIVRGCLGASEVFGGIAEGIPLAMLTWKVGKAAYKTAVANASGGCRPGLSYITHP
jgi:hypothetical protein